MPERKNYIIEVRRRKDFRNEALRKIEEIINKAVVTGADSITIEYAKEGGLEVCFMFGNTGVGEIFIDRALQSQVMKLIHETAYSRDRSRAVMHCTHRGRQLDILFEEYDNFGETAFRLILGTGRKKRR